MDDVDVLSAFVFKGLQNLYLTKEFFEGIVSILRILLIILPISFDDFYCADLLGFAVLAERAISHIIERQCQKRGLPFENSSIRAFSDQFEELVRRNVKAPSLGSLCDILLLLLRLQNLSRSCRSLGSRFEEITGHLISTILNC